MPLARQAMANRVCATRPIFVTAVLISVTSSGAELASSSRHSDGPRTGGHVKTVCVSMAGLSGKNQIEEVIRAEREQVEKSERIDGLNGTTEETQRENAEDNRRCHGDNR